MYVPPHVQRVLERIEGVARNGFGWKGRCPSHDDENPSLSIAVGDDGRVLLRCHVGCDFASIVKALGLEPRDFFAPGSGDQQRPRSSAKRPRVHATLDAAIEAACPPAHRFVKMWTYANEQGAPVMHVARYDAVDEPKPGEKRQKQFRPVHPRDGGFVVADPSAPLPIYHLPELTARKDEIVFATEGEKAADALAELGLLATTTAHGSNGVKKADLTPLAGRNVVITPDQDAAGEKYTTDLTTRLLANSPPAVVKILRLPDLPTKGDAVEFIADRRAKGKSDAEIRAEIESLVTAAPSYTAPKDQSDYIVLTSKSSTKASVDASNDFSETRNAERLAEHCGGDLHFVPKWNKHIAWDGKRWRIDFGNAVSLGLTKKVLRAIRIEAVACASTHKQRSSRLWAWAKRSEAKTGRNAMLELVRSESGITIPFEMLDADPYLLNLQNGALELGPTSVQLREHRREDLITRLAPVRYDPTAACPTFDTYLERILPDPEVRQYLQRVVGMCLTGDVSEQVIVFFFGSGANGKSVFLLVLHALLGTDYALQAKSDLLLKQDRGRGHPTELASLFKKNLVVCTELGAGRKLDEPLVKQLTGGDLINARRMREDEWQFPPTHKILVACNHKPRIDGQDHGVWRRIALVPFTVTIPDKEQDKGLVAKLCKELPGILNWATDGYLLWRREGLRPPAQVLAATANYREEMDVLADFIADKCVVQSSLRVTAKDLYAAYEGWCRAAADEPLSKRSFGIRLTDRGVERVKSDGNVAYLGLGLKADAPA